MESVRHRNHHQFSLRPPTWLPTSHFQKGCCKGFGPTRRVASSWRRTPCTHTYGRVRPSALRLVERVRTAVWLPRCSLHQCRQKWPGMSDLTSRLPAGSRSEVHPSVRAAPRFNPHKLESTSIFSAPFGCMIRGVSPSNAPFGAHMKQTPYFLLPLFVKGYEPSKFVPSPRLGPPDPSSF